MLFNSWQYALFLPTVVAAYQLAGSARRRRGVLLVASYVFYAAWDWRFLSLILLSTGVDFVVARRIALSQDPGARKRLVTLSVVVNLGLLATFKYLGFFVESAAALLDRVGLGTQLGTLSIVLPVGISFYTFQTLSYTIDVYRRRTDPERDLITFALFVAFFPQLVAGPIERAERLLPQLAKMNSAISLDNLTNGIRLIGLGLFRKVVLADGVAPLVDATFGDPAGYRWTALVFGAIAFSIQIYGDFAGYTDIARGTAKLFGVDLIENFRGPYSSKSFSEFWRRWHISLSEWLRDYLYIPLGGNRSGRLQTARNLMVTMLLGGLWHGAAWTFVLWGALHGGYLMVERYLPASLAPRRRSSSLWIPLIFSITTLTWIPFRAGSWDALVQYLLGIVSISDGAVLPASDVVILLFAAVMTWAIDDWRSAGIVNPLRAWPAAARGFAYGMAVIAGVIVSAGSIQTFIYFQF